MNPDDIKAFAEQHLESQLPGFVRHDLPLSGAEPSLSNDVPVVSRPGGGGRRIGQPWHLGRPNDVQYSDRYRYAVPSGIRKGDIIFSYWYASLYASEWTKIPAPSKIDHAGVIVGVSSGDIEICQHSMGVGYGNHCEGIYDWQHAAGGPQSNTWVWIVRPGR
jgi:hypothetical protein